MPAQIEGGCSLSVDAVGRGGRICSLQGPGLLDPWTPAPLPPGCCGAGDWLTLICSQWEQHSPSAVYCIRGMLYPNQLSGRLSLDLIPTLDKLCTCSMLTGKLAGQDSASTCLGQIFLEGASTHLSGTALALVSPGDYTGGWRGSCIPEDTLLREACSGG